MWIAFPHKLIVFWLGVEWLTFVSITTLMPDALDRFFDISWSKTLFFCQSNELNCQEIEENAFILFHLHFISEAIEKTGGK
jgi:hypothetical protein